MSRNPDPCERVFLSIELSELLNSLPRDHKFWNWIDELGDLLLSNRDVGIKIPRNKFPKKYVGKYGINNLTKFDHPEGYRSCYTLVHEKDVGICSWILGLYSHREYEDLFGYR